jgi:predicted dehydrogenase
MARGKRIGFVDHTLENFHANVFLKSIRGPLASRGYSVAGCFGLDADGAKAWAEKNAVPFFADAGDLDQNVDHYMILAPSNPETHLDLCRRFVPFGKPTYVDKTFAPDIDAARLIFELADQHDVALQSSSALRYTAVQKTVGELGAGNLRHMITWGGGSSFAEYAIHPIELAVSCLGAGATRLMRRTAAPWSQLLIDFTRDRTAVVNVYTAGDTPFAAAITSEKSTQHVAVNTATLFVDTAAGILDFFDKGAPLVERQETLAIRKILDAAEDPAAMSQWLEL